MKKKCENCWIGKRFKKNQVMTEDEFKICYFQCLYNEDGGDWEKDES